MLWGRRCSGDYRFPFMEKPLSLVVVVADAQPRRPSLINDPLTQRREFGRIFPVLGSPDALASISSHLKCPADKRLRALTYDSARSMASPLVGTTG